MVYLRVPNIPQPAFVRILKWMSGNRPCWSFVVSVKGIFSFAAQYIRLHEGNSGHVSCKYLLFCYRMVYTRKVLWSRARYRNDLLADENIYEDCIEWHTLHCDQTLPVDSWGHKNVNAYHRAFPGPGARLHLQSRHRSVLAQLVTKMIKSII